MKKQPMEKFNLLLSPFMYKELVQVSEKLGISKAEIIRQAILKHLQELRKDFKIK